MKVLCKVLVVLSWPDPEVIVESEACSASALLVTIRPGMHQLVGESAVEEEFLRQMQMRY